MEATCVSVISSHSMAVHVVMYLDRTGLGTGASHIGIVLADEESNNVSGMSQLKLDGQILPCSNQ